ncbi:hypothetical protein Adi01nite_03700 [Amorphoplanes digitatis]|nr:hypothetical protein Adi01nite_03700 [Actinoplanes digitatis]
MWSKVRSSIALVAVLVVVLAPASAAHADPPPVPFTLASCATSDRLAPSTTRNQYYILLDGQATACAPTAADGGIRFAVYPAGVSAGTAPGYLVRLFGPAPVRAYRVAAVRAVAGEYGVCLLAGENVRVSCYQVRVVGSGMTAYSTVQPLAVSAPLVNKDVVLEAYIGADYPMVMQSDGDTTNGCGTCF